jgi:hypothetical protein
MSKGNVFWFHTRGNKFFFKGKEDKSGHKNEY